VSEGLLGVTVQVVLGLVFLGYGLFSVIKKEISFGLRGSAGADYSMYIKGIPAAIAGLSLMISGIVCLIPVLFYDLFTGILRDRDNAFFVGIGLGIAILAVGVFFSIILHIAIGTGKNVRHRNQDDQ
jgi:hypothetical protein